MESQILKHFLVIMGNLWDDHSDPCHSKAWRAHLHDETGAICARPGSSVLQDDVKENGQSLSLWPSLFLLLTKSLSYWHILKTHYKRRFQVFCKYVFLTFSSYNWALLKDLLWLKVTMFLWYNSYVLVLYFNSLSRVVPDIRIPSYVLISDKIMNNSLT